MQQSIVILQDTASGLNYLHSLDPQFIHGHLTAENILLDARLRAKIGVFAIESNLHHLNPECMPLEAEEDSDSSLNIFSFGHLALVTILKEKVGLLPSHSVNEAGKRSRQQEVDRQARFMQKARKLIAKENGEIMVTIQQCHRNNPAERPNIMHVLETLHRANKDAVTSKPIDTYEDMSTEQAESVVKEMLQKEGKFKQKNLVVVLTGLMEAGKTTLLHQLFGKDLNRYNSTGIAERSLRGLTQYLCSADKELRLVENPKDMFDLVARVKMVPSVKSIDSEVSNTTEDEKHNAKARTTVNQITDSKERDTTIVTCSTAKVTE
ncbi:Serine/threonine-protein kinase CTR1, partial [Geodia barretti]